LAHGNAGQHAVDQVGRGVGHAASAAGRTEAASFAREGDSAIETAGVAVDADEAVGEDPAAQERLELAGHEYGDGAFSRAGGREEGLELAAHCLVEHAFLGASPLVGERSAWRRRVPSAAGGAGLGRMAGAHRTRAVRGSCHMRGFIGPLPHSEFPFSRARFARRVPTGSRACAWRFALP